jgi:PTH1 family peptidyl-tRNA hydrolase
LGTADYWRLRIGVGHPGDKAEVVSWVLKKPMLEQRKAIDDSIHRAVAALPLLLAGDMEKAMVRIHTSKPPRPKPPRPVKVPTPDVPTAE